MKVFNVDIPVVSENLQKDRKYNLYLYIDSDSKGKYFAKFGEAQAQSVWDRYKATGAKQHTQMVYLWSALGTGDKEIHRKLKSSHSNNFKWAGNKSENELQTNEAYELYNIKGLYDIKEVIENYINSKAQNGKVSRPPFQSVVDLVDEVISTNTNSLLYLCPRWGKTSTSLEIIKRNDTQINIMCSYIKTVDASYSNDIASFTEYDSIDYYNVEDLDVDTFENSVNTGRKIFLFFPLTGDMGNFSQRVTPIKKFLKKSSTSLFIEEADFGAHTDEQIKKLKALKAKRTYILSGTGIDKLNEIKEKLSLSNTHLFTRDYIIDVLGTKDPKRAKGCAGVEWHTLNNTGLVKFNSDYEVDEMENWSDLFSEKEGGTLKGETYIRQIFTALLSPSNAPIGFSKESREIISQLTSLTHQDSDIVTEIFLPTEKSAHSKAADILKSMGFASEVINGDVMTNREAEEAITDFIKCNAGKKKVVVCGGMATRSFSIPQIKNVILMLNDSSANSISQKVARGLTPYSGKVCKVVDLRLHYSGENNLSKWLGNSAAYMLENGKSHREVIQTIASIEKLNFYEHFQVGVPFKKLDENDLKVAMLSKDFVQTFAQTLDPSKVDYTFEDSIEPDVEDRGLTLKCENFKGSADKTIYSKTVKSEKVEEEDQEAEKLEQDIKRAHLNFLLHSKSIFCRDNESMSKNIKQLCKKEECVAEFKKAYNIDLNFLSKLCSWIESEYSYSVDELSDSRKVAKINKGYSDVDAKLFGNVEKIYDLVFSKIKFNENENVAVAFWGSDYFVSRLRKENPNVHFTQIEGNWLFYNKNCKIVDIKSVNLFEGMKKFDKIIMNPPYDGNLHLKVVEKCIRHITENGEVINLSPVRWLQDPLAKYKKNSDYNKFEKSIAQHIKSLDMISAEEAQNYFKTAQYENLAIYNIDKAGGFTPTFDVRVKSLFDKVNIPTYTGKYKSLYSVRSKEGKPDYNRPFLRISPLHGNVGAKDWADIISSQENIVMEKPNSKSSCDTTINEKTEDMIKNLFHYLHLNFIKASNLNVKTNMRVPGYAIPYLGEVENPRTHKIGYESDWTNEDLCKVFGITGFISDTEAEADSEWEEILETMKDFN